MKIALVSDIHGNIPALEVVTADLKKRGVDQVFNLGDHLSGPLWPQETAEFLLKQDWISVAGNHDRNLISQDPRQHNLSDHYTYTVLKENAFAWLKSLPALKVVNDTICLFHGSPLADTAYFLETIEGSYLRLASQTEILSRLGTATQPVLVCGHTHVPRVVQFPDGPLMINPGSLGLQGFEDTQPHYHVAETGSPMTHYAVMSETDGQWAVEQITLAYDYQSAAEQARRNQRPDWEAILLTGYVRRNKNN